MNNLETIRIILTVISGICWTIVYIEGIRLGFKHRSYAIPFYALALNFAWESLYTYYGFQSTVGVQAVVNAVWFVLDIGILVTYFKFGRKYFPAQLPGAARKRKENASCVSSDGVCSTLALRPSFTFSLLFERSLIVRVETSRRLFGLST